MRGLRTPHSEKLSGMNAPFDFRYLVVPHTHWDREWYVPFEVFRLRLGAVIDGVLDKLEADPEFRSFTLDGQGIVLEDYADVRPDNVHRLRALLAAGRLEAGPWYVLPDEILVGSEALVRNLLLGRRVCRRFGVEPTAAGYEPDSFGHPAQLPQILAGFGLRTFLFSRGLGDQLDDVGVVFRWQAAGTDVVACQFLPHYDNFARLTTAEEAAQRVERINERFGPFLERAKQGTIVLANGSDHLPVQPQLPEICRELGPAFRIGRVSDFEPETGSLSAYEGELVGSRLQNILRGVNSARMYLKQANERAERRLLGTETVAALRALRDGSRFPHEDIRLAWRDLLRNHPHDSICGCSCDEVHRDMLVRYEQLDRTLDIVEREALGVGGALVNPLPYRRSRLVGDELVELDGFEGRRADRKPAEAVPFELEIAFEDEPDVGDLYTFCPGGPVRRAELVRSQRLPDGSLLRCVGTISRPKGLPTRPVDAGPDIPTPDGQCRGRHVFEYALHLDADRLSNAALIRAGQDYRTDFLTGDPFAPPLSIEGDVVFSCLKGAEDGNGLILRVFNPNERPETVRIEGARAARVRLDEEAPADDGLVLGPGEIGTFALREPA